MFHKHPRPVSEEIGGVFYILAFSLVWYTTLTKMLIRTGFQIFYLLFLAAGLLPLEAALRQVRRALRARKTRQKALEEIAPIPGTIQSIQRTAVPVQGSRGRVSLAWRYVLQVEFWEPGAQAPRQITSEAYRLPIQNDLASTRVNVYPLPDGWHFILDGFDWKENRKDPGPFPPEEYHTRATPLVRVVFLLFCLYFLYQMLFAF